MASAIFSNFGAFLMAILLTILPNFNFALPVMKTKEENCELNLVMFSDVHIETNELFRKSFVKTALKRANNAKDKVDGIVMAGDITNYADEESLADYYEIITDNTDLPVVSAAGNHDIGHVGDRDKTDITKYEALANIIKYQTEYQEAKKLDNYKTEGSNYYSCEINGYKFIVLGDEVDGFTIKDGEEVEHTGGHWDGVTMTHAQIDFLDRELAEGTAEGKPCFVVSHWPICNTVSEDVVWPDSGIDQEEYDLVSVMEQYKNVVYISGHMHSGTKSKLVEEKYGITSAEKKAFTEGGNEVIYFSLPTLGIVNAFGLPLWGRGATLEVYENHIIWRPVNYLTGNWYEASEYSFNLD